MGFFDRFLTVFCNFLEKVTFLSGVKTIDGHRFNIENKIISYS